MSNTREMERLALLEAALYAAGRPVDIENLKTVIRTRSNKVITRLIEKLARRYEVRGSALEVKAIPEKRAVMRLKPDYSTMVKRFTNRPLLTIGPLRTLSYIAYHQPVEQVKVVTDRGSHVYNHLKLMEEMGLISRERINGRGYVVETTAYFSEYFGFGQDPLKTKLQLRQIFSTLKIHKLNNGNGKGYPPELMNAHLADGALADSEENPLKGVYSVPR